MSEIATLALRMEFPPEAMALLREICNHLQRLAPAGVVNVATDAGLAPELVNKLANRIVQSTNLADSPEPGPADAGERSEADPSPEPPATTGVSSLNLPPEVKDPPAVFLNSVRKESWKTQERLDLLIQLTKEDCSLHEILNRLNALPGKHIENTKAIMNWRYALRQADVIKPHVPAKVLAPLTQPAARLGPGAVVAKPANVPPPRVPKQQPAFIAAEQSQIVAWAAARGIRFDRGKFDLEVVNKKARALGLPEFTLKTAAKFPRRIDA